MKYAKQCMHVGPCEQKKQILTEDMEETTTNGLRKITGLTSAKQFLCLKEESMHTIPDYNFSRQ